MNVLVVELNQKARAVSCDFLLSFGVQLPKRRRFRWLDLADECVSISRFDGHLNPANRILITRRSIIELNLQVRAARFILE
jgi:hypothetical protein